MRYALPLIAMAAILMAAPGCGGCGRGPTSESATIGEAVEETVQEIAEGVEQAIDDADTKTYTVTENSYIGWAGRKPLGTHFGQFPSYEGAVTVKGDDLTTARADVTFHTAELSSDDTRLTGVLLDSSWFNVEEYPTARFVTTSIEQTETGYRVTGNLRLRDANKSVTFPADIRLDNGRIELSAEFSIDRTAWGIGQGLAEDLIVYNDVAIELEVEAEIES
jgi:polyisoprenoid-binding protein YceI